MNENLFQLILSIIPVLGAIITYFVVPYLKAGISSEKLNQYKEWAALAVKTAEMLWRETGHGTEKKSYAEDILNHLFNAKKTVISEEQIHVLIEAAVQELNKSNE